MSRGLGKIERQALAALENQAEPVDVATLAALIYGVEIPDGEPASRYVNAACNSAVRRALNCLARIDLVIAVDDITRTNSKRKLWTLVLGSAELARVIGTGKGEPCLERTI